MSRSSQAPADFPKGVPIDGPTPPRSRALFATFLLAVLGVVPGMGIPGGLMLGAADRILFAVRGGGSVLQPLREGALPLALLVTVLLPLPLVPLVSWVSTWRRAGSGPRLFAVILGVLVWGVLLGLATLLIKGA